MKDTNASWRNGKHFLDGSVYSLKSLYLLLRLGTSDVKQDLQSSTVIVEKGHILKIKSTLEFYPDDAVDFYRPARS